MSLIDQLKNCAQYAAPASLHEQQEWGIGKHERYDTCIYRAVNEAINRGEVERQEGIKIFGAQLNKRDELIEHMEANGLDHSQIESSKIISQVESPNKSSQIKNPKIISQIETPKKSLSS